MIGTAAAATTAAGILARTRLGRSAPQRQASGTWRGGPEIPTPRSEVAAATAGGVIYVLGGLAQDGRSLASNEALFSGETAWRALAPLPQQRDHLAAVELDGRLWALAGSPGWFNQQTSTSLWVYDAEADRWEDRAPLPLGRAAHAAAALDGRIYVAGGIGPEPQQLLAYDAQADSWSLRAPLSRPREHLAATAIGSILYLIGGRWADVGNVALLEDCLLYTSPSPRDS